MNIYERIYLPNQLRVEKAVDSVYWIGEDGKRYLDLLSGGGAFFLWNYGDKELDKILSQGFLSTSNFLMHKNKENLSEKLTKLTGYPLVYFLSSGSEAVDAGIYERISS